MLKGGIVEVAKAAVIAGFALSASTVVQAADDADKILKAMSDYVGAQKLISATFDSDIEVITPDLQKIQFTSSGQVQLSRPDKIRATRAGGYRDVEVVFDGKLVTVNDRDTKNYAQFEAAGSADQLIDALREKNGV